MAYEPQELVQLTGVGKFVWDPVLEIIDFVPKGKRTPLLSINLLIKQNCREGALRRIGKWLDNPAFHAAVEHYLEAEERRRAET